ncbi:hypothetical protein EDS67_22760 [candidate division KSB1 bacterium]|nr:MAG: hypothetical protein EDS67_22760 [candidate division KSB1 bacterium]MBC6949460.1 hypothetical protein [candidate division KSB1 bacterium]MCE7945111.1 hypothetical protein [Chlorobi bacterium CHB1]MDL1874251.1 hypothetical protein [Cytophagia bacterium CHB2]
MSELGKLEWSKDKFAVWGGKLKPTEWLDFLEAWKWKDDKRWRILEFVSDFKIEDDKPQIISEKDIPLLERAEFFGKSGHLSTRRDGETVYWHFVGERDIKVPDGYDDVKNNYWTAHPEDKFRRSEKHMLLWGERIKDGDTWTNDWFDDRVGWAKLSYPHVEEPKNGNAENQPPAAKEQNQRVQANYWQFTRAGQVAFVWLTGLSEYQPQEEQNG